MDTAPLSPQQRRCASSAEHDLGIVPQTIAYHRMLAHLGPDGGYDEFDDVDHSFSDSDSEDMAKHPNNSYPAHPGRNNETKQSDPDEDRVPVFAISFQHLLLTHSGPRTLSEERLCINSSPRPGLWVTEPNLGLSDLDMGFLSQLAQLCIHTNIKGCSRDQCRVQRAAVDKIAPQCDWSAFREWALVTMSCPAATSTKDKESPAHTHIVTVV